MNVYIVRHAEYWRNYRGQEGSMHSIQRVFDTREKAVRFLKEYKKLVDFSMVKDTSDEPERVVALRNRVDEYPVLDLWIEEMEVE